MKLLSVPSDCVSIFVVAVLLTLSCQRADASIVVIWTDAGTDLVASSSGSIDLTGFTSAGTGTSQGQSLSAANDTSLPPGFELDVAFPSAITNGATHDRSHASSVPSNPVSPRHSPDFVGLAQDLATKARTVEDCDGLFKRRLKGFTRKHRHAFGR